MQALTPSPIVLERMRRVDMIMSMMSQGNNQMGSNVDCYLRAFELWNYLANSPSLRNAGLTFESPPEGYCFRIQFPANCVAYELSISVPTDAFGNRGETASGLPETFETALFGNDDNLIYNEDLGYDDICRFYSNEEVESDILRLAAFRA